MNPDVALVESVLRGAACLPARADSSEIARALDMQILALDREGATATIGFAPADVFLQGAGVLQGGAVAAMLDYAMIIPVMAVMPEGATPATANLSVSFFRAAPLGRYTVRARIRRQTRSVIYAEATLLSGTDEEIASGSSTTIIKAGSGRNGKNTN